MRMTPEEKAKEYAKEICNGFTYVNADVIVLIENAFIDGGKEKDKEIETCIIRLDLKEEKLKQLRDEIAALKDEIEELKSMI